MNCEVCGKDVLDTLELGELEVCQECCDELLAEHEERRLGCQDEPVDIGADAIAIISLWGILANNGIHFIVYGHAYRGCGQSIIGTMFRYGLYQG